VARLQSSVSLLSVSAVARFPHSGTALSTW
jgi:hypothetical protein